MMDNETLLIKACDKVLAAAETTKVPARHMPELCEALFLLRHIVKQIKEQKVNKNT